MDIINIEDFKKRWIDSIRCCSSFEQLAIVQHEVAEGMQRYVDKLTDALGEKDER